MGEWTHGYYSKAEKRSESSSSCQNAQRLGALSTDCFGLPWKPKRKKTLDEAIGTEQKLSSVLQMKSGCENWLSSALFIWAAPSSHHSDCSVGICKFIGQLS